MAERDTTMAFAGLRILGFQTAIGRTPQEEETPKPGSVQMVLGPCMDCGEWTTYSHRVTPEGLRCRCEPCLWAA
jgi:hypothetical protein